jgi:hypothetical protein
MQGYNENITRELLSKAGSIIKKYEAIARETGASFNIFEIADISTKETTVCRVLTELLSPAGHHGQGGAYLEIFLRNCLGMNFTQNEIDNARVYREYSTDRSRKIDIVAEVGGRFIPIEVKIYAEEGVDQCYDYLQFARNNKNDKQAKVVYLTLGGQFPSEFSAKGLSQDDVLPISFADDILNWLEKCVALPQTIKTAPIREILIQFVAAIRKITNQSEDKPKMEMLELLSASPQNMRNAEMISHAVNACKSDMIFKLLKAIEVGFGKEKLDTLDYESENGQSVALYYDKKRSTYPSINYMFKRVNAKTNLWFRVEIGWQLYAGLCVVTDGKNDGWTLSEKDCEMLSIEQCDNDWWSNKWSYLPNETDTPHFKTNDENSFFRLFDKEYFNVFVGKCVKVINESWELWENDMK